MSAACYPLVTDAKVARYRSPWLTDGGTLRLYV